jgi:hypothetical protein
MIPLLGWMAVAQRTRIRTPTNPRPDIQRVATKELPSLIWRRNTELHQASKNKIRQKLGFYCKARNKGVS